MHPSAKNHSLGTLPASMAPQTIMRSFGIRVSSGLGSSPRGRTCTSQHPGPSDAVVHIAYQTREGAIEREPMLLAAGSRTSINVGSEIGETYDVSILVNSSTPIVVERAVYWNSKVEGTCSTGYPSW